MPSKMTTDNGNLCLYLPVPYSSLTPISFSHIKVWEGEYKGRNMEFLSRTQISKGFYSFLCINLINTELRNLNKGPYIVLLSLKIRIYLLLPQQQIVHWARRRSELIQKQIKLFRLENTIVSHAFFSELLSAFHRLLRE